MNRYLYIILLTMCFSISCDSQTIDTGAYNKFTFINQSINKIENDSTSLISFYEKLYQLQKQNKGKVTITHIGDSHIQADHMSGIVRQELQLKFGNAGRGFIFPYRVAKSNEPSSYKTISNLPWEYKRNVFPDKPLPIGIGGYTIETKDTAADIVLTVKDQPGLGYKFTKFTLFHEKGFENFDITICDDELCTYNFFAPSSRTMGGFVTTIKFPKPLRQIIIQNKITDSTCQRSTRIYGMLLENDSAGVLYNMIGVNGAEYRHYNMSKYFYKQMEYLNSDLVILSLGTNEAYSAKFDSLEFLNHVDTTIANIKRVNPNAVFLITTPSDSYRKVYKKGRVKNPDMRIAHNALIAYSKKNNIAYWNLYDIMGGYGSMQKWYLAKLTAKDKVHFSVRGYQIQGDLFYNALIEGYEEYVKNRK